LRLARNKRPLRVSQRKWQMRLDKFVLKQADATFARPEQQTSDGVIITGYEILQYGC